MFEIRPKGWRKGQTLFNFLEWLHQNKGLPLSPFNRMADTFNIPNDDLEKLFRDFTREWKTEDARKRLKVKS